MSRDSLKKKIQAAGICNTMFGWLTIFLMERKQYAEVNRKFLSVHRITFGVPQRYLLGPQLFSILVSYLPGALSVEQPFTYADDTTNYHASKNVVGLTEKLNTAANELCA